VRGPCKAYGRCNSSQAGNTTNECRNMVYSTRGFFWIAVVLLVVVEYPHVGAVEDMGCQQCDIHIVHL
jgi:hypothetical protein